MKTFRKYTTHAIVLTVIAFSLLLQGCSEDFLTEEPTGLISSEQLAEASKANPDIVKNVLAGIYSTTFEQGTGGTTRHDDFGQKAADIVSDLMSGNMAMSGKNYGWFSDASELTGYVKTSNRAYIFWRYYYRIIKSANEVIETLGEDATASAPAKYYYGQALALRAYAYYNLINFYAPHYLTDKTAAGVPIYAQTSEEAAPRSSVQEVYAFIVEDLTTAIEALDGFQRTDKNEIDQSVAQGLLAYAYLQMGDWGNAKNTADAIISSAAYPMMNKDEITTSGFRDIGINSWMWAIDLTLDNSPALPTFWGHVDYFTYSYAWAGDRKTIDAGLYAKIPATDTRKTWFHSSVLMNWYKFYDVNRKAGGNRNWDLDEVYMRVEEMYLIKAEAALRNNEPAIAKATLSQLLAERDATKAAALAAMTNDALLEEIYFNWQLEFWGEGKGLVNQKRFKKAHVRGSNHLAGVAGTTVNYSDSRLIYEIPQAEELNNPNL